MEEARTINNTRKTVILNDGAVVKDTTNLNKSVKRATDENEGLQEGVESLETEHKNAMRIIDEEIVASESIYSNLSKQMKEVERRKEMMKEGDVSDINLVNEEADERIKKLKELVDKLEESARVKEKETKDWDEKTQTLDEELTRSQTFRQEREGSARTLRDQREERKRSIATSKGNIEGLERAEEERNLLATKEVEKLEDQANRLKDKYDRLSDKNKKKEDPRTLSELEKEFADKDSTLKLSSSLFVSKMCESEAQVFGTLSHKTPSLISLHTFAEPQESSTGRSAHEGGGGEAQRRGEQASQ
jgi:DNA repair exonuclease SbcCD ATPase subunit